jgi:hypothetical protein
MKKVRLSLQWFFVAAMGLSASHCSIFLSPSRNADVYIPFIKNSPNECYFLDEFMPVPDGLVKGKTGSLNLRYYTYKSANYKDWQATHIILSFYSQDDRCWSLFEEYLIKDNAI